RRVGSVYHRLHAREIVVDPVRGAVVVVDVGDAADVGPADGVRGGCARVGVIGAGRPAAHGADVALAVLLQKPVVVVLHLHLVDRRAGPRGVVVAGDGLEHAAYFVRPVDPQHAGVHAGTGRRDRVADEPPQLVVAERVDRAAAVGGGLLLAEAVVRVRDAVRAADRA